MIEPYVVEKTISYSDFDNIFEMLSLREQYLVVDILIAQQIDLVETIQANHSGTEEREEIFLDIDIINGIEEDEENNDVFDNPDMFEIKYDENIFRDGERAEQIQDVKQFDKIKQSNTTLCHLIQHGNLQAMSDLCVKNQKLVFKYAQAYYKLYGNDMDLEDLQQVGFLGLIKAAERFDFNKECAFSTYAVCWIKQAISRDLIDYGFTIRLPVHVVEKIRKAKHLDNKYYEEGYDFSERIQLISQEMNLTETQVSNLFTLKTQFLSCTSLNVPVGEEGDIELGALIEDKETLSPEDLVLYNDFTETLEGVLSTLTKREETILRLRFGFDSNAPQTLEAVGKTFGVTRERIRQIEAKALRKLRHPSRINKLRDYL